MRRLLLVPLVVGMAAVAAAEAQTAPVFEISRRGSTAATSGA